MFTELTPMLANGTVLITVAREERDHAPGQRVPQNEGGAFILAAFALVSVSLLASFVPARRATKVDPITALQAE